jgi:hypothetical protein
MRPLTDHFFRALFDFGILSTKGSDSFKRMLLGAVGGLLAIGFGLTRVYAAKYGRLIAAGSRERYQDAMIGDDLFMVGLSMLLVAAVTLLVSHSLFPDERDFRILGPLPVRRAVVFRAKLTALLMFSGSFVVVTHLSLLPLMLLTSLSPLAGRSPSARLAVWAVTSVGASMLSVLAVTAIVGLLVLALSRSHMNELAGLVRSALLALLVLSTPFVFRLANLGASFAAGPGPLALAPPAWIVGLQQAIHGSRDPWFLQLAGIAVAALVASAAIVVTSYAVLFRDFERLMLRAPGTSAPWPTRTLTSETPAFRAVHGFTMLTLRRSPLHQGVLVGLAACGAGLVMNRLAGAASPIAAAVSMPFVLMFACGVGVRTALALPMSERANWIFRLLEDDETRREQMRAVERIVTGWTVFVPVVVSAPVLWVSLGPQSVVAVFVALLTGLVFVHLVLADWRRVPFTCSYLPGKRFLAESLLIGGAAFYGFTLVGAALVRRAIGGVVPAIVILVALGLLAWLLRRRRLSVWSRTPLMFEDEFPDELLQLRLTSEHPAAD